jgi:hypothetical protein
VTNAALRGPVVPASWSDALSRVQRANALKGRAGDPAANHLTVPIARAVSVRYGFIEARVRSVSI